LFATGRRVDPARAEDGADGAEGVRRAGQRDVPVPAGPAAHRVLGQPHRPLRRLAAALDRPATPGDAHELGEGRAVRRATDESGHGGRAGDAAAEQHPALPPADERVDARQPDPVVAPRSLRPRPRRQALPAVGGRVGEVATDAPLPPVGADDRVLAADREDVAAGARLRPHPQVRHVAVDAVGGDPGGGHARVERPFAHGLRQFGLRREGAIVRDPGGAAALAVVGPTGGQVERPIQEGVAARAGIGEEHADLGVGAPPRRAAVPRPDPRRLAALLQEPDLVDHQHALARRPGGR